VDQGIEGYGGIPQIFMDSVWPIIEKVIPERLGQAFAVVPFSSAKIGHTLHIKGVCEKPDTEGHKRRCPAEELVLDIEDNTQMSGLPLPIIEDYMSKAASFVGTSSNITGTGLEQTLQNVLDAYAQGKDVFPLSQIQVAGSADLSNFVGEKEKGLMINAMTSATFSMHLLQSIVGEDSPLMNFIPDSKLRSSSNTLSIKGGNEVKRDAVTLKDGVLSFPDVKVSKIRLPLVLNGKQDAIELDATMTNFKLERVGSLSNGEPSDPEPSLAFGKGSQLEVHIPDVTASLHRTAGVHFSSPMTAGFGSEYISQTLAAATEAMGHPTNVRDGPSAMPDGEVPAKFQRPASRMKGKLDLVTVIKSAQATGSVSLRGEGKTTRVVGGEVPESLELQVSGNVKAKLLLSSPFWRGLLDSKDQDFGYMHFSMSGHWGKMGDTGKKAVLMLGCGTLELWEVEGSGKPFEGDPTLSFDLMVPKAVNFVMKTARTRLTKSIDCMHVQTIAAVLWGSDDKMYFCGNKRAMQQLDEALGLQINRFSHVADSITKWPLSKSQAHIALKKQASPDGTWFKEAHPKQMDTYYPQQEPPARTGDIMSPHMAWKAAQGTSTLKLVADRNL